VSVEINAQNLNAVLPIYILSFILGFSFSSVVFFVLVMLLLLSQSKQMFFWTMSKWMRIAKRCLLKKDNNPQQETGENCLKLT